jgi:hypothetical protein
MIPNDHQHALPATPAPTFASSKLDTTTIGATSPGRRSSAACRWPIGDHLVAASHCCRPVERGAYCSEHAQIAYLPFDERGWKKFQAYALKSA